jgi:hypothetical protein
MTQHSTVALPGNPEMSQYGSIVCLVSAPVQACSRLPGGSNCYQVIDVVRITS